MDKNACNKKIQMNFLKSKKDLLMESTRSEKAQNASEKLEKEHCGSTESKSSSSESDVSGHDKPLTNGTDENLPFFAGDVKQEPTESEMQTFAHHTMNELLGLYGYEQVGENDIKRIRPVRHNAPASLQKPQENLSELSPNELRACASQSIMSYSDDEEVKCAWCGNPSHPAFTLKEDDLVKSFCSEKCFAACRRAKFKKTRGNTKISLSENLLYGGKITHSSSSESDREQPLRYTSPMKRKGASSFNETDNQERFSVDSSANSTKNKLGWLLKDESAGKEEEESSLFAKKNASRSGSADSISEIVSKAKKKDSPQRHKTDYYFPQKTGVNPAGYSSESALKQNKRREKSERKISSDSKKSFRSTHGASEQANVGLLNQQSAFNFQPPINQTIMGFPNFLNPAIGPPKLDLDSFRLGMLAACNQTKLEKPIGQLHDSGFTVESQSPLNTRKASSAQNKAEDHSNCSVKNDKLAAPKISCYKGENKTMTDGPKIEKNDLELDENKKAKCSLFSNIPAPMLMLPFPIPIPIPFLLPIPLELTKPSSSQKNELVNEASEACNQCRKDVNGGESKSEPLRFSWGLKTEIDRFAPNTSDQKIEPSCLGSMKTLEEQKTSDSVCAAIDLSIRTRDDVTEISSSSRCHAKRQLDNNSNKELDPKGKIMKLH